MRVLHVDSSPRSDLSISRRLTKSFIDAWRQADPDIAVTYRDLGLHPVPFVDETWIAAAFTPPEEISPLQEATLALSNTLIDELLATDFWLFGIPMYNYSVPANFKAYIDQIVRVRRTFIVNETGEYKGLVHHKKVVVITARSGVFSEGTPGADADFQSPFLKEVFSLIGATDLAFIHAENLAGGPEARQQSLDEAHRQIQELIAQYGETKS